MQRSKSEACSDNSLIHTTKNVAYTWCLETQFTIPYVNLLLSSQGRLFFLPQLCYCVNVTVLIPFSPDEREISQHP